MKKLFSLLPLLLALTFAHAAYAPSSVSDFSAHLKALDQCIQENFGTEINHQQAMYALYQTPNDVYRGNIAALVPEQTFFSLHTDDSGLITDEPYRSYYPDPLTVSYFPVLNCRSASEVYDRFSQYLAASILRPAFEENFLVFDNRLYLVRGPRGYGTVSMDVSRAVLLEHNGNEYILQAPALLFGEPDGYYTVFAQWDGKSLLITRYTQGQAAG